MLPLWRNAIASRFLLMLFTRRHDVSFFVSLSAPPPTRSVVPGIMAQSAHGVKAEQSGW